MHREIALIVQRGYVFNGKHDIYVVCVNIKNLNINLTYITNTVFYSTVSKPTVE